MSAALCFALSLASAALAQALDLPQASGVLLLVVVVGGCSTAAAWSGALVNAALGWLVVTGFVVGTRGELRVNGTDDLWRPLLLAGVAGAVAMSTGAPTASRSANRAEDRLLAGPRTVANMAATGEPRRWSDRAHAA